MMVCLPHVFLMLIEVRTECWIPGTGVNNDCESLRDAGYHARAIGIVSAFNP